MGYRSRKYKVVLEIEVLSDPTKPTPKEVEHGEVHTFVNEVLCWRLKEFDLCEKWEATTEAVELKSDDIIENHPWD